MNNQNLENSMETNILKDAAEAVHLFEKRFAELVTALKNNDLSLAQFPRVGNLARLELVTRQETIQWVLEMLPSVARLDAASQAESAPCFIGVLKERNGEYSYRHITRLQATTEAEAEAELEEKARSYYDNEGEKDGDGYYHHGGEVFVEAACVRQVSRQAYDEIGSLPA